MSNISGTIVNENGIPIKDAIVKLLSTSYNPLAHVFSDLNGRYSIDVKAGSYNILVIANNSKLKNKNNMSIQPDENLEINFILSPDPSTELSLIMGELIDSSSNDNVSGAIISLFKKDINNDEQLYGRVYSNENGQFAITELSKGQYKLVANALGYNSSQENIIISENQQIISAKIFITKNSISSNGTVSGIIMNEDNELIVRGDVILYKVETNNSLTPIAFTKTNEKGVYLFSNVPKGTYKVKANKFEVL